MKKILYIILSAVLLCGCGSSKGGKKPKPCKGNTFVQMYEEQPRTLAILPSVSSEFEEEVRNEFNRSVYLYLGVKGYDIVESQTMKDKLQEAGLLDFANLMDSDCSVFKKQLGADAVLFTTILKRGRDGDDVIVSADYVLKSTSTGQVLYHRVGTVIKPSNVVNAGDGLWGALLSVGLTMAKDAVTTNYDELYDMCNELVFKDLPYGPNHKNHNADQSETIGRERIEYTLME